MIRTQIYIDENTHKLLNKESKATGKSVSQIIRENIADKMNKKANELLNKMERVYGIWKDREFDVDDYLRDIRKDRKLSC
jgi:hypothetical protein